MCKWGTEEKVWVRISADLSCTGKEKWKHVLVDKCIAPIVRALQKENIDMRGSCCGHECKVGDIHLQDGRVLIIADYGVYDKNRDRIIELLNKES